MSQRRKLDAIFVDGTNEYGPIGNDTGSDVFALYREWRGANRRPGQFLAHLLQTWGIGDCDWDDQDANIIVDEMESSERAVFERLTRDDAIIALAVAQILVDGVAQPKTLDRALKAIHRQTQDRVIEFRGWDDPSYRKKVLKKVKNLLEAEH